MNFNEWYKRICNKLQENGNIKRIENLFLKQASDIGRVSVLLENGYIAESFVSESFIRKCNKQSELYRATGNKLYGVNSLKEALKAYTKSIMLAEQNTEVVALSYANRSAVLFALKEFALCQEDIVIAFENGYPMDLHHKLYERHGKCLYELTNFEMAKQKFDACIESLEYSKLNEGRRIGKAKVIQSWIGKCVGRDTMKCFGTCKNTVYDAILPEIAEEDKSAIYMCATSKFLIQSDEQHGRYAVAGEDICAGEVIVTEKPFASVCLPECFETHCYQCLSRFKVLYPCRCCSRVGYCSRSCEVRSWDSFHKHECRYLGLLVQDDIGLGHLALKTVVRCGFKTLLNFDKRCQRASGLNESGVYDPSDYFCLYSLVGNSDLRSHADLFRRSLMAVFLVKILESTGFFLSCNDESVMNDATRKTVASHLLKQIQMLPCNAHEVSEAQLFGSSDLAQNELKEIGSAAYTTLSLLNHSCDPSVVRHCYGDVCVLRALKHIKKGEEIIDNYGFLYAVQQKEERIQHLSDQYFFKCQCVACLENWPIYSDLSNGGPQFQCEKCQSTVTNGVTSSTCSHCSFQDMELASFYENNFQGKFHQAMETVLNGDADYDVDGNLSILLNYLDLLTRKAKLPVIHVNNCQEIVKLCFSLKANFAYL